MPAAAVIPAPRAYTDIAAVKTLVVGCWAQVCRAAFGDRGVRRGRCAWGPPRAAAPPVPRPRRTLNPRRYAPAPVLSQWRCRTAPAPSPLQWGPTRSHTQRLCARPPGACGPPQHRTVPRPGPPPEPTAAATVENSVCPTHPPLAGCPSMEWQSIDRMLASTVLCWPWCPSRGTGRVRPPRAPAPAAAARRPSAVPPGAAGGGRGGPGVPGRGPRRPPIGLEGTAQGEGYCSARGEILRPLPDRPQRRRSARACSSIKNESVGSEDDQTPS